MRKAFTLIELLFVMAIIGVLAGFALQSVTSLQSFSNSKELETAMFSSKNLIDKMFRARNHDYIKEDLDSEGWKEFNENGNYYIRVGGVQYRFSNGLKGSEIRLSAGCCAYVDGECLLGYYISMRNPSLPDGKNRMSYNSCTQNQPSYTANYGGAE